MHFYKNSLMLLVLFCALVFLSGCGDRAVNTATAATPVFSSTPVRAAAEGSSYSYTVAAAAPDGSMVNYSLTSAPSGATLNGSTITWTPAAAQSRVPNAFTVTANSSSGGRATQSWTVSPNGTVQVTAVNTYWGPNGAVKGPPIAWSEVYPAAAVLVPQGDGTFEAIYGTGDSNGVLRFQNVPTGHFWLSLRPNGNYWTSSSVIDWGRDVIGEPVTALPAGSNPSTTVTVNLNGLDATGSPSLVQFFTVPGAVSVGGEVENQTGFTETESFGTSTTASTAISLDLSTVHTAFALQDEAAPLGPLNGYVLGPELTLSGLTLTNGVSNTINGTLMPSTLASLPLKIDASDWAPLFDNAAPTTPTPVASPFGLRVEPFVTGVNATITATSSLGLFWPAPLMPFPVFGPPGCGSGLQPTTVQNGVSVGGLLESPLLSSDTDFGTIQYGDPFPATWHRVFSFCQQAALAMPSLTTTTTFPPTLGGSIGGTTVTTTWNYYLSNRQSIAPPTAPVTPLISPVQNPTLNGASLFTEATLDSRALSLSWEKPALGTPYGYAVEVIGIPSSSSGCTVISAPSSTFCIGTPAGSNVATLYTAQTSVNVPPEFLTAGQTYLISITALMDAKANVETSPLRSALPTASADVVSAPITINASAP